MMMKAVGYRQAGGVETLADIEIAKPTLQKGRDLLVRVKAISVNPIDTKLRRRKGSENDDSPPIVLGFDCVGVVEAAGDACTLFQTGDRVYYAGDITRPGTNAQYHVVDERIAGRAPSTLSDAEAAALPLTTVTAYEMLFDRLRLLDSSANSNSNKVILVVGGAGGVGSIALQLVRALAPDFVLIATASRPETEAFCKQCGAHHVIDHSQPLAPQVATLHVGAPSFVFSTTHTDQHLEDIVELMAPQGRFGLIDDPAGGLDVMPFKRKSISIHWELMFTRSMFDTPDLQEQHVLLNKVADLVEEGKISTTMTSVAGPINAATLRQVHTLIESGKACGKIVLEGFD